MSASLPLLASIGAGAVWRATALSASPGAVLASGHVLLDQMLPGGGWPVGAAVEILQAPGVHAEWRLLLPALRCAAPGAVVLVGPPHVPFGPALAAQGLALQSLLWVAAATPAECGWASEQALRCADVVAVLAWLPQMRPEQLRRLHLVAQSHRKLLFVMRPAQAQQESSPAVLRLLLANAAPGQGDALVVQLLKRRGPPLLQLLQLPARPARLGALLALSEPAASGHRHSGGAIALDRLAATA
jgi:protein ImuA